MALQRRCLLTMAFGDLETRRILPNSLAELEHLARDWVRPLPDVTLSIRVPVEYASIQAARLVAGPYIYLTNEDSFQITTENVHDIRVEIFSDSLHPLERPFHTPSPPVLEAPATSNLQLVPGERVALDTTAHTSMLLSAAGSSDGLPGSSLSFWSKFNKDPDLGKKAPVALQRTPLVTMVFGDMETIRILPNSFAELEQVAMDWVRPSPDTIFSLRIPVEYVLLHVARLAAGPYIYLTNEESFQLATRGALRIRVEIVSDYPFPLNKPLHPPSPPVLEMPTVSKLVPAVSYFSIISAPPVHLLSMSTVIDLQQAIHDLCKAQLAQGNSSQPEGLQETLVQEVMEYLQAELDSTANLKPNNHHPVFGTAGVYYKRCLRTLRQLSVIYKVFPSSLVIRNVRQEGRHAIGGGGFADIYRGTIDPQRPVCLKVLRLVMEQDEDIRDKIRKEFCNEALIWRQLKHPNILPLLGVNAELFMPSFCLISPWMENKDIITYLRKNPTHNRHTVLSEVAAGLSYLHSRDPPILHGDIRGANILVSKDRHCCLADFGLTMIISDSRTFSNVATSAMTKGTTRWMAPELIIPNNSAKPTANKTSRDVYAFGCTILEILTLQLPFHDKTTDPAVIYSLMMRQRPDRPGDAVWYPDPIWDLTTRCWTEEAEARPSAQEIYEFLEPAHIADINMINGADPADAHTGASTAA